MRHPPESAGEVGRDQVWLIPNEAGPSGESARGFRMLSRYLIGIGRAFLITPFRTSAIDVFLDRVGSEAQRHYPPSLKSLRSDARERVL